MRRWLLRILICSIVGHKSISQVKIHRKRVTGMHRGYCTRCRKTLWVTYPFDKE